MPGLFGKYHRFIVLFVCIIETIFMSGILYGWNGLVPVWMAAGIFGCEGNSSVTEAESKANISYSLSSSSTPPPQIVRKEAPCNQKDMLSIAFIVTSSIQFVITLPCGMIFDRFGLRASTCLNGVLFCVACVLMGFVTPSLPHILFLGGSVLSLAAPFVLLCNFQIGVLFPGWSSFVVAVISGCFDSSAVVFLIISKGFEAGISILASFVTLGISGLVVMVLIALLLFPKKTMSELLENKPASNTVQMDATTGEQVDNENAEAEKEGMIQEEEKQEKPVVNERSLLDVMKSRHYILQLLWFSCILLRFQFLLTALPQHISFRFPDGGAIVGRLFTVLSICLFGGVIFAPLAGFLLDFLMRLMTPKGEAATLEISLKSIGIGQLVCTATSLLMTVLIYVDGESVFYVIFILEAFSRAFLFSLNGAFSIHYYPGKEFGKLFGIMFLVGGIFSCIQFAILELSLFASNAVVLVCCIISCLQPVNLIIGSRAFCKG